MAVQSLTVKYKGIAGQIITDIRVSAVYDPASPPNPLPPEEATKALWDTGASKSVISQDLAKRLNLKPVGATNVNHAGGVSVSPTYMVHFSLPHGATMAGVLVTEFPGAANFGAIIGMDIITVGDFAVTNVGGFTVMSFRLPTTQTINFVADAQSPTNKSANKKKSRVWKSFK